MTITDWQRRTDVLLEKIEEAVLTGRFLRWRACTLRERARSARGESGMPRGGIAPGPTVQFATTRRKVETALDIDIGEVWNDR